jgi:hypothetical protein
MDREGGRGRRGSVPVGCVLQLVPSQARTFRHIDVVFVNAGVQKALPLLVDGATFKQARILTQSEPLESAN